MKLIVDGMTCSHCERAVKQAIQTLGGTARVDLQARTVEVDGVTDQESVRSAIEAAGYDVLSFEPDGD